jgi:hypothetical protein
VAAHQQVPTVARILFPQAWHSIPVRCAAQTIEVRIGVRENGVFYVFGQTAMFYYLVHRLAFETPATYFGLRGFDGLAATFGVAAGMLVLVYPMCRWYRTVKASPPRSVLRYL